MDFEILTRATDDEGHPTSTTEAYEACDADCLAAGAGAAPVLHFQRTIDWVLRRVDRRSESGMQSEGFCPWNALYALFPLRALGYDRDPAFPALQQRLLAFFQHRRAQGVFSGFPDDDVHAVTAYAGVCGLALLGLDAGYALVDRQAAYRALLACKLPCGAFATCARQEHDVRATFCALLVADVLGFLTPAFAAGAAEYVLACECYDGGIAPRPGLEAHGGYVHCGVGAMKILGRLGELRLARLARWIATRQLEFSGGFCGRANKLVDSCYTWWVGSPARVIADHLGVPPFWNERAVARYVLQVAQGADGGFCSRPPAQPDPFHTLYALAGLCVCGGRATGEEGRLLPEVDPLVPCPRELVERMRAYFRARPFVPE
jgi:protein farnesyltransferase subunit beta